MAFNSMRGFGLLLVLKAVLTVGIVAFLLFS